MAKEPGNEMIHLHRLRGVFVFSLLLTALYWQSIYGDFVLDDRTFFIENDVIPSLRPWNIWEIFFEETNYWGDVLPVRDFLYVLEYSLFGLNTSGYHLVSIGLYILVCFSVYVFLRRFYTKVYEGDTTFSIVSSLGMTLRQAQGDKCHGEPVEPSELLTGECGKTPDAGTGNVFGLRNASVSAFLVTLIFAVYPVHVEAVAYITGQKDLLFSLFSLNVLSVFYIFFNSSEKKKSSVFTGIILYYLALLSKPTAIVLSIVVPLIYFLSDRRERPGLLKSLAVWFVVQLPAILWILTYMKLAGLYWSGNAAILGIPFIERITVALKILGAHTVLALKPFTLSFGYPFSSSATIDTNLVIGFLVLATVIGLLLRFRKDRIVVSSVCLYIFYLLVVLQLHGPLGNDSIYDRYVFIPVLGVAMLIEHTLRILSSTWKRIKFINALYPTIIFGIVIVFSSVTFSYIPAFRNDIAVTKNTYEKFPEWRNSSFNYVYSLIDGGRLDDAYAVTLKEETLSFPPWVRGYFNGWILLEKDMLDQAIPELRASSYLAMHGGYFPFPNIPLARALIKAGRESEEAIWLLRAATKSPVYQPLEVYRARKLLQQIGADQSLSLR
ncbi:MAG TPA: hypothetical protein VN328_04890 [Thermodesulfovibrionales bacterium]|nr:hypothetical protein [Thermodesulfovibrionales bacterium]